MNWIILAVAAPFVFAVYHVLSKSLPGGVSVFLVTAYAFLSGTFLMFLSYFFTSDTKSIYLNSKNLVLALSIGACIAFGNFLIIKAFALGAPQSSFSAIIYPLLIIFATISGVFVWHEKINAWQLLGILLAIAGIILIFYFKESSQLIK